MKRSPTWTICRHHDAVVLWLLHLVGRPEDKGSVKLWPPFPLLSLPHCKPHFYHTAPLSRLYIPSQRLCYSTLLNLIPVEIAPMSLHLYLLIALPTRGQSSYGLAAIPPSPHQPFWLPATLFFWEPWSIHIASLYYILYKLKLNPSLVLYISIGQDLPL